MVSNPWYGVRTFYWVKNMMKTDTIFRGITGCVSDIPSGRYGWDWCIEIFLGSIWERAKNFDKFVEQLSKIWLHEYLHMIIDWERVYSNEKVNDSEKAVKTVEGLLYRNESKD